MVKDLFRRVRELEVKSSARVAMQRESEVSLLLRDYAVEAERLESLSVVELEAEIAAVEAGPVDVSDPYYRLIKEGTVECLRRILAGVKLGKVKY